MEQYFCTFKYYDKKGRRLAVFCRYINPLDAELFTLTCSDLDQFDRTFARSVYEKYLTKGLTPEFTGEFKPSIELIQIQPERREIWTLLNFCRKNYWIEAEVEITVTVPILFNEATEAGFGGVTIKIL